jgi:phosphoribosyl 1,2-cyclic phosphodiesterase
LRVHLCGVRGSTPAPGIDFVRYGGNTSCVALAHDDAEAPTLILDAGTGLKVASAMLADSSFAGTLLLTHLHWDHVLGLPFFPAGDNPEARVHVVIPEQPSGASPESVLAQVMSPPYFPIEATHLRGSWSFDTIVPGERSLEDFLVTVREVPHKGGRTFGYRIEDGHSSLAYIPDHCPTSLGPGPDGLGEYHASVLELADQVDLLIHDAQLLPEELAADAGFGHAAADYAVELGRRAGAHSVVLFHHRTNRTDEELDELAARLGGEAPQVHVASEGTSLTLQPEPLA